MYSIKKFQPRKYQQSIIQNCNNNTLVCLPTGTGKTKIAISLLIKRLSIFPEKKILLISPTKPLSSQIESEIKECTTIPSSQIKLLTGMIKPEERTKLFNACKVIVATPQTIQKDLENKRINLKEVSLLVVDECHRSKEKFANTKVARDYVQQSNNPLILALTASPGSTREKISEVCENLYINNIEVKTEEDEELSEYLQKKEVENIKLELPDTFKKIKDPLNAQYKSKIKNLITLGFSKPHYLINKKDLILLQIRFQKEINKGSRTAYRGISLVAELLKLNYALELIETQTPKAFIEYIYKLQKETSKASKNITNQKSIQTALKHAENLCKTKTLHPKMVKLKEIITNSIKINPKNKTIIFANYRSTVSEIKKELEELMGTKPTILVGQKDGVTQKDQLKTIEKFNNDEYNILICTSIGEEGLSIGSLDQAIFYDQTASEIRKIQRSGRVARIKEGRIINLITSKTRDEGLHWIAKRKEQKMHNLLHSIKRNLSKQQTLSNFNKPII